MGAIDNLDKSVSIISKIADLFKKNGFMIAFLAILLFGVAAGGMVTYKVITMDKSVNEVLIKHDAELKQKEINDHIENSYERRDRQDNIYNVLDNLLLGLNADRAYVVEMHNGNNNPSGLAFIYGEMTYEKAAYGIDDIDDDYNQITLSRYQLPIYLANKRVFTGSVDELESIDAKIAKKFRENGATYVVLMAVSGKKGDIGMFGITYCNGNEPAPDSEMKAKMSVASQKLTLYLDRNTNE